MNKIYCRGCRETQLVQFFSLGNSPLANNLSNSVDDIQELYPLTLMYCPACHNVQLSHVVPAHKMFDHYLYVSSTTKSMRDHFQRAANSYVAQFNLADTSLVVDIGSNDGVALSPLKEQGVLVVGIEPAKNIAEIANTNGIPTINSYCTLSVADALVRDYGNADVVTASNVFAHADDLEEIAHAAFRILKKDGSFIIEVQYLLNTIQDLTFDNIYHEHTNYWSVTSLTNFFSRLGYTVYKIEFVNTHGGSIRAYIKRDANNVDDSVKLYMDTESSCGLTQLTTYQEFAKRVEQIKQNIFKNVQDMKRSGLKIVGYGAPAKATTALNYFGLTNEYISYIVEDNSLKHGKFVPGVMIPIFPKTQLEKDVPDKILVLAWNFFEDIKHNNPEYSDRMINIKDLSTS